MSNELDIQLRPLQVSDVSAWYSYLKIPKVVEHTSWDLGSQRHLEKLAEGYNLAERGSNIRFAITRDTSGLMIGTVGFNAISESDGSAEIAYDVHPDYWGYGIATKACRLALNWGFNIRNLKIIKACILPANVASEKVLSRRGFVRTEAPAEVRLVGGKPMELVVYSVSSNN